MYVWHVNMCVCMSMCTCTPCLQAPSSHLTNLHAGFLNPYLMKYQRLPIYCVSLDFIGISSNFERQTLGQKK